ncbi:UV DNA damage repair endonuclease UvsE [Hutsoniella sourekii]|uniref:UV DNA damage repair endonuclease UvsE n=1 Tax=Hutsoniella sourekii TaxID=87650 RepID=UPI00048439F0|nr:UV DNA damage repair endonuclease UvsE [Hutsoniella sourekii]
MAIGYACLTVGGPKVNYRTCRKQNATPDKLKELIKHNLLVLSHQLDYNHQQGIRLFRITSDLIPFGSDLETNSLDWGHLFRQEWQDLAQKIKNYQIRVSAHPGQYTVLNTPKAAVLQRTIADLEYHDRFLTLLETDSASKIVLHIGGIYGDKQAAMKRFVDNYQKLNPQIKKRLVIENDDRLYTIQEVLNLSQATGAPVVYDNLHNACNPADLTRSDRDWIQEASLTWAVQDGPQAVHYSQQKPGGRLGSHTATIYHADFLDYYYQLQDLDLDIVLEVKDKNLSAVKCINLTRSDRHIKYLEAEWARYKYSVLEHSPSHYQAIRQLLKDKTDYPAVHFYSLLEEALDTPATAGSLTNAYDHVWGYFKDQVTNKEKANYRSLQQNLQVETSVDAGIKLKRFLKRMAKKYPNSYLDQSLFFEL